MKTDNKKLIEAAEKEYIRLEKRKEELAKENKLPTFNCHTHIFNFDYVNDKFIKGMFSIRFVFLIIALFLIIVLVGLLLAQLIFGNWLFNIVNISSNVFYSLAGSSVVLIILFVFVKKPFITIGIQWMRKHRWLRKITKFLDKMPFKDDILKRMANFIKHSYYTNTREVKPQKEIFEELSSYYSAKTKFVVLTMDMDYMINCKDKGTKKFYEQLNEIRKIKEKSEYKRKIFPFIHADPRRLDDIKLNCFKKLEDYIEKKVFHGIKIYPALGYFPFDKRLKPVYDLALKYNLPITTHCSVGPVYYRGNLKTLQGEPYYYKDYYKKQGAFVHPFTDKVLHGKTPKDFTPHFTHPLNYYCLMAKPEKLADYWNQGVEKEENKFTGEDMKKYRNLKFCLGHFGGSSEWVKYLKDAWLPSDKKPLDDIFSNWTHDVYGKKSENKKTYSWHTIIYDMLTLTEKSNKDKLAFPNLYSDISFNVSNEQMLPLLKVRLETNKILASKILFGTDFFMVSLKASEREITMKLRSFIGEDNFKQIAKLNPLMFLSTYACNADDLLG